MKILIIFTLMLPSPYVACAAEGGGDVGEPTLTPGLLSAFKAAESMRRELVSRVFSNPSVR